MIFKGKFGIYHNVDVDADLERQLWQSGKVHGGIVDLFTEGSNNGRDTEHDLRNKFPGERERRS